MQLSTRGELFKTLLPRPHRKIVRELLPHAWNLCDLVGPFPQQHSRPCTAILKTLLRDHQRFAEAGNNDAKTVTFSNEETLYTCHPDNNSLYTQDRLLWPLNIPTQQAPTQEEKRGIPFERYRTIPKARPWLKKIYIYIYILKLLINFKLI